MITLTADEDALITRAFPERRRGVGAKPPQNDEAFKITFRNLKTGV